MDSAPEHFTPARLAVLEALGDGSKLVTKGSTTRRTVNLAVIKQLNELKLTKYDSEYTACLTDQGRAVLMQWKYPAPSAERVA